MYAQKFTEAGARLGNLVDATVHEFYLQASRSLGFLRFLWWTRLVIFVLIILRFYWRWEAPQTWLLPAKALATLYGVLLLIFGYLAYFRGDVFKARTSKAIQIVVDMIAISFTYAASFNPRSGTLLLYLIPLLIIARFFRKQELILFLVGSMGLMILGWLMTVPPAQLRSALVWGVVLVPRLGMLGFLSLFYLIYQHRHRQIQEIAKAAALKIDQELKYERILDVIIYLLKCSAGAIYLKEAGNVDTGKEALVLQSGKGYPAGTVRTAITLNNLSVVSKVFLEGKLYQLRDVNKDSTLLRTWRDRSPYHIRTMACFPLTAPDGERIGVLCLNREDNQFFEQDEIDLVTALGYGLGNAYENRRLLRQTEDERDQQTRQMTALVNLSAQLVSPSLDLEHIYQLLAHTIRHELRAENATLFLRQEGSLYRMATDPRSDIEWLPDEYYEVGGNLTGKALISSSGVRNTAFILENDVEANPFVNQKYVEAYKQNLPSGRVKHLVAVPLEGTDRPDVTNRSFGLLRAVNKLTVTGTLDPFGFTERDLDLLRMIASMAAVSIENRRRITELAQLDSIGRELAQSAHNDRTIKLALDRVTTVLNAESASLLIPEQVSGRLQFVAAVGPLSEHLVGQTLPSGKGVAWQVFTTGEAVRHANIREHPFFYPGIDTSLKHISGSVLSVAVDAHGERLGVIQVLNKRQGEFTEDDQRMLRLIAMWLAIALESANMLEAADRDRNFANALRENTRTLSLRMPQGRKVVLETILKELKNLIDYDSASVALFDQDGETLRLVGHDGFPPHMHEDLENTVIAAGDLPVIDLWRLRRAVSIDDNWTAKRLQDTPGAEKIRSWAAAPLLFEGKVIGLIAVDHFEPYQFGEHHKMVLETFAEQAAVALKNSELYARQERWAQQLLNLNGSLIGITRQESFPDTVRQVAKCTVQLMGYDMAAVALFNEHKHEIYIPLYGYQNLDDDVVEEFHFKDSQRGGKILTDPPSIYILADRMKEPRHLLAGKLPEKVNARSIIAYPLVLAGRRMGILYGANSTPHTFTQEEQDLFSLLAQQAALAIRNRELYERAQKEVQLRQVSYQISLASQLTTDIDRILHIYLTGMTKEDGLRFNRAILLLDDQEEGFLCGKTAIGPMTRKEANLIWESMPDETFIEHVERTLNGDYVPELTSAARATLKTRIPIKKRSNELFSRLYLSGTARIVDLRDDISANEDFVKRFALETFAVVPFAVGNRRHGLLIVDNKFSRDPIRQEDLAMLIESTGQAVVAYERAKMLHNLQTIAQNVTGFTSDGGNLGQVLQKIVDVTRQMLDAGPVYLVPYDEMKHELVPELAKVSGQKFAFVHRASFTEQGLTNLALNAEEGQVFLENLSEAHADLISEYAERAGGRAVAVMRLKFGEQVQGVLYVNYSEPHKFTDVEKVTLSVIADAAATAIHNMRRLAEWQESMSRSVRNRLHTQVHSAKNSLYGGVQLPLSNVGEMAQKAKSPEITTKVYTIQRQVSGVIDELDRVLNNLGDPLLIGEGLGVWLRSYCQSRTGVRLICEGDERLRHDPDVEIAFHFIAKEAIDNSLKYAYLDGEYPNIRVGINFTPHTLYLNITDDGVGFDKSLLDDIDSGSGLSMMEAAAREIDAHLRINAELGQGTKIEVQWHSGGSDE